MAQTKIAGLFLDPTVVSALTAITDGAPAVDYLFVWDAGTSTLKKILLNNLGLAPIASPTFTTGATSPAWITGNSGTIKLVDGDGNHFTTIAAHATTAADVAYTWPDNAPGTSGYALTSTTGGVMSWAAVGGGSPAGSAGWVQYSDGSSFAAEGNFFWNASTNSLGVGTTSPTSSGGYVVQVGSANNAPISIGNWLSGYAGVLSNAYHSSGWKYVGNDYAMGIRFHHTGGLAGSILFNVSPVNSSGAATAISNWDDSDIKMEIDSTGEVLVRENNSMPSVTQGIAKAWMKNSGATTPAVEDFYNCTLTDSGVGYRTYTFGDDFENDDYVCVGNAYGPAGNYLQGLIFGQNTLLVGSIDCIVRSTSGAGTNVDVPNAVAFFGERT